MANTADLRNIILVGHGGSGKTSLAESMLHKTGASNRLGSVDDKTSICDYYDEEKEHQHSILPSIVHITNKNKDINIIDTAGAPDFVGSSIKCIPAAETACIVINAASGIETVTRKMFELTSKAGKPTMFVVNKIDADNIDLVELVKNIHEMFGTSCRCANVPSSDCSSVIDCIKNESGDSALGDIGALHTDLLESVIEANDELMEKYLGGEEISAEKIGSVFVEAMIAGTVIPILFSNAKDEIGVDELVNFITEYTPSPDQVKPAKLINGDNIVEIKADSSAPFRGLVFRVGSDPKSNMKYSSIKIFSGTLKSDTNLMVDDATKGIRPGHVLKSQGAENNEISEGVAGDIITLAKLEELAISGLVHDGGAEGKFEEPPMPEPMFSLALEPAARGDEQRIGTALDKLCDEDPCFKVKHNAQTRELVIYGMGELHLRVTLEKMEKRYKLAVNTKEPKIPYKETITGKADGHYRHKKQTGGSGQFGEVYLRVEPAERDSDPSLVFSWDIFGGSIPGQFEAPIAKGISDIMSSGVIAGFPMQDVKVSVYDGKHHPVDSKEVAFRAAGKGAFVDALQKAKPALLEPIVDIEVTVPAENMGDITGDLASKRGRVQGQDVMPGGFVVIKAQVPLSEVTQYNSQLKSVTGGRGSYTMALSHYEPLPPNIQQQVMAQYKKEQEEE